MDIETIKAQISAQNEILAKTDKNREEAILIDNQIKQAQKKLIDNLMFFEAKIVIESGIPVDNNGEYAYETYHYELDRIDIQDSWETNNLPHLELSFEKQNKEYAFYCTEGEISSNVFINAYDKSWLYYPFKDTRKKYKLTGASVEVKKKAFNYLTDLINKIYQKGQPTFPPDEAFTNFDPKFEDVPF